MDDHSELVIPRDVQMVVQRLSESQRRRLSFHDIDCIRAIYLEEIDALRRERDVLREHVEVVGRADRDWPLTECRLWAASVLKAADKAREGV